MKNKIIISLIVIFMLLTGAYVAWNFIIPSQDIKKNFKDLRADAVGLERKIVHTLNDGSKKSWECKTKIYPFPSDGSSGSAFTFIDTNGKKIICGPGWRIEEK